MRPFLFTLLCAFVLISTSVVAQSSDKPPDLERPAAGVVDIEPGLSYLVLEKATGPRVTDPYKIIRTRSDAWMADGTQTGSAADGLDATQLRQVRNSLPFLARILEDTPTGEKRRWWISSNLIPEGSRALEKADYIMDIEIVDVLDPLPAPSNVASIPENAKVSSDGIGILTLQAGDGVNYPNLENIVVVHYSGWTTDGRMFDSSRLREATASFPLGLLITGWQLAIPELSKGESARIWIPGHLAYDNREDRPFAPKGMLVFDVELIDIEIQPVEEE